MDSCGKPGYTGTHLGLPCTPTHQLYFILGTPERGIPSGPNSCFRNYVDTIKRINRGLGLVVRWVPTHANLDDPVSSHLGYKRRGNAAVDRLIPLLLVRQR
jgi:hypothetical protein